MNQRQNNMPGVKFKHYETIGDRFVLLPDDGVIEMPNGATLGVSSLLYELRLSGVWYERYKHTGRTKIDIETYDAIIQWLNSATIINDVTVGGYADLPLNDYLRKMLVTDEQ
jgi:hypothetical protein